MDVNTIKLLEEKIQIVKEIVLNTTEISEETKKKRIAELEALETEILEMKNK